MAAAQLGVIQGGGQHRPHPVEAVGGDAHAHPAAADQEAALGPAAGHRPGHRRGRLGVVGACRGMHPQVLELVALGREAGLEGFLEFEAGVVGAQRDPHDPPPWPAAGRGGSRAPPRAGLRRPGSLGPSSGLPCPRPLSPGSLVPPPCPPPCPRPSPLARRPVLAPRPGVALSPDRRRRPGGVGAAEAEGVAQHVLDHRRPLLVGHVVQVAGRVGGGVVDGGRQHLVADGEDGEGRLDPAGGAQHVAGHGFGGGDRELLGVGRQDLLEARVSRESLRSVLVPWG